MKLMLLGKTIEITCETNRQAEDILDALELLIERVNSHRITEDEIADSIRYGARRWEYGDD